MSKWILLLCCACVAVPSAAAEIDPAKELPMHSPDESTDREDDEEWLPPVLTDETEGLDDY